MNIQISDKIKELRKEKNISQEKLAAYLNVSFQAVSKWENGITSPDISLLPDIARFFDITIDELFQTEKLDEKRLYDEYRKQAEALARNGKSKETLEIWLDAFKKMPNNVEVKEMLMSTYYDIDKTLYQKEIIELGTEIYNSDVPTYYKGQAITEISKTYAENGNYDMACKWISKSMSIFHSKEILYSKIEDGQHLINEISFCTYWVLNSFYYMACRIIGSDEIERDAKYKQNVAETVLRMYEAVYIDDDMSFESLNRFAYLNIMIAELEMETTNREETVKKHLSRALDCALKSVNLKEHTLSLPLLDGWNIPSAPDDNMQIVRMVHSQMEADTFSEYRKYDWFTDIINRCC